MLFLAHRKEIVDQTADKISQQIGTHLVAIEQAERRAATDARVVVASIQSLSTRLLGLKDRLEKIIRDGPSLTPSAESTAPALVVKELSQGSSIQEKLKAIKADFAQRNRS
jgi:hypothetical protein